MKTTAADLMAWFSDQSGEAEVWLVSGATFEVPNGAIDLRQAMQESKDYLLIRAQIRLEEATTRWRKSIRGSTDDRLRAWRALCDLREEFEAGQGDVMNMSAGGTA